MRRSVCPTAGLTLFCALLATVAVGHGQQTDSGDATDKQIDHVPRVPGIGPILRGVNGGLTYAGVNNSVVGWYQVLVPAVSYSFSEHYAMDTSATFYLHRYVQNLDPKTGATQQLVLDTADAGDTLFALHGSFRPHGVSEMATLSLSAPTGNRTNGLGTGRVTFDFNNHAERFWGNKGLHLDLGMGDSSSVANSLLIRDYNTLGALAHFEAGAALWSRRFGFLETSLYEQLPVGSQKVYKRADASGQGWEEQVLVSNGLSEDNGVTMTFGMPLTAHLMFSGYYNHSMRQRQDTVSLGMTFVVRSLPGKRRLAMIDRALREAAGLNPNPD